MKKTIQMISLVVSLILPFSAILTLTTDMDIFYQTFNLYTLYWCGFYGSIASFLLFESKLLKGLILSLNLTVITFFSFVALMGGSDAVLPLFIKMLLPFYTLH